MLRILFYGALYISPLDALLTVTGRGELVLEAIEFDADFPIDGVVLVFGCGGICHLWPRVSGSVG